MKDEGCPTCGSKDFGMMEIKKDSFSVAKWKMKCHNCQKFWYKTA